MKTILVSILIFSSLSVFADATQLDASTLDTSGFYRALTLKVRSSGMFRVPVPGTSDQSFSYELKFGLPIFDQPIISDFYLGPDNSQFVRNFWDKVLVLDGSTLKLGNDEVPLTCVFIEGQDNRFSKKDTPLIPDFLLRVYLVANDYTCLGPINPGWPSVGKKESWDTYLYFEIRDPTIMLPTEVKLRYRWNELPATVIDGGVK